MRAHDGLMPRRAPGWPLAATLGVHLLLGWWWLQARPPVLDVVTGVREMFLVPVLPAPVAPPAPDPVASPSTPTDRAPRPKPVTREPQPTAAAVQTSPPTAPSTAPEQPSADPSVEPAAQAATESTAARAIRAAGAIDHSLRSGKLDKLKPADTPGNRFINAMEAAHNDTSRTMTSESYTTPDGVTIYRFRRGNKVYCRSGGHVRPGIGNLAEGGGIVNFDRAGGEGGAGLVACPGQAAFKRD